jgi:CheY-like chemotaxis protein
MSTPVRALLVEDNPGDADLIREVLETSRIAADIVVAVDGVQALAHLRGELPSFSGIPDLILLDLNLPKMGGRQVLSEIKNDPRFKTIPVVVLTSSDAEQDIVKSYELGAACYVTKPLGLDSFQTVVRSIEEFWFRTVQLP